MKAITRRSAIRATLGLPLALSTRARAQSALMNLSVIESVISYGGGFFTALKAGMNIMSLNTDEMLGMHMGLIQQLRSFGGADDYLNLYMSSPPPMPDPDEIYGYLAPHFGKQPQMQATLHDIFASLPAAVPGMYEALFSVGGHDAFNNLGAGVYQYYNDIQGGIYSPSANPAGRARTPRPSSPVPRSQAFVRRAAKFDGYPDDLECSLYPELCYFLFPPPVDPCDFNPLACVPPWPSLPGMIFPWSDSNDPKTPKPKHGMTKEEVCFYATKMQWYLGQIASIYTAIIKREAVLITLSGEIILATPVATEVIAAIAIGMIVVSAVGQLTC